jgi:hypothetical protein
MATYPNKLIEAFASQALRIFYMKSVSDAITNSDYEGEIKDKSSILNVLTFGKLTAQDYSGSPMTAQSLTESSAQLVTNQAKYFYFQVKDWDTFRSYVKNPENTIVEQVGNEIKKVVDTFVLTFWGDVAAGNRIGTDYTTGTVEVTATTGAVVGTGTTFTSAMVGKPFKATGQSKWYRVKTYTNATNIVIENDVDDLGFADPFTGAPVTVGGYDGGAIAAGATYTVQAATALTVTKSTIFQYMTQAAQILTDSEIPYDNRWMVVPARIASLIRQAPEFISQGTESGRMTVLNGMLSGQFAGFNVYEVSEDRIDGDNTNGYHCLGGHKSAICFAMGLTRNQVEQDIIGNFGKAYKSLYVYGAKVADERRKALVELFIKA